MKTSAEILELSKSEKTPFYFYDLGLLRETLKKVEQESSRYNFHVHYALKANTNSEILNLVREHHLGADCVSGNEIKRAIDCGFRSDKIVFAGVGKSDDEINFALDQSIFCFNCESVQEIEIINELAAKRNKIANIAVRINPNVNANTHKYITTGLEENKFGISISQLPDVIALLENCKHLKFIGLHFHIGSQITDMTSFANLCTRVNEIQKWLLSRNITLKIINVGGGLGIDYHHPDEHPMPDFESYFALFNQFLELQKGQELHFELGRAVVAQCGSLVTKVLYIKNGINTNFAIVDAGMTELIRPALYQSYHKIENLSRENSTQANKVYDVVGPICESSDFFGKRMELPETFRGDIIVIRSAGAYGEVMASNYNLREKAKAVYTK